MEYSKEITVADQKVRVHELTVQGLRDWLLDTTNRQLGDLDGAFDVYSVDRDLFPELRLDDLERFTDLSAEKIDALRPSDLRQVIEAVKEVNPDFFAMRERMSAGAAALVEALMRSSTTSSAGAAT